jgi:tungstate transport system ATP-binding protein
MAETLLALQEIEVRYADIRNLEIPALMLARGEVLAIMGPNGAGKSTLLRIMGLLQPPSKGKIYFQGKQVKQGDGLAVRRHMATVFQEPLLVNSSLYENVALGLKLRGFDRRSIEQRVKPWLDRLAISHLVDRHASSLSGGEAQRASLARAFVLDPELLLLDEPFSALDPPTRETLLVELEAILRQTGITTVFVTHEWQEAFALGDRVGVLMGGEILQIGPAAEVFMRPVSLQVAKFVGIASQISGVVEWTRAGLSSIRFGGGSINIPGNFQPGERVLFCIRPEEIRLGLSGQETLISNGVLRLKAKVAKIVPWGSQYRVVLDCAGTSLVALATRPSLLDLNLRQEDEVVASFHPAAVHVITGA